MNMKIVTNYGANLLVRELNVAEFAISPCGVFFFMLCRLVAVIKRCEIHILFMTVTTIIPIAV